MKHLCLSKYKSLQLVQMQANTETPADTNETRFWWKLLVSWSSNPPESLSTVSVGFWRPCMSFELLTIWRKSRAKKCIKLKKWQADKPVSWNRVWWFNKLFPSVRIFYPGSTNLPHLLWAVCIFVSLNLSLKSSDSFSPPLKDRKSFTKER